MDFRKNGVGWRSIRRVTMKKALIIMVMLIVISTSGFSQTVWNVNDGSALIEAVNGIRSGGNNKTYTINVAGTISAFPSEGGNTFGSVTGITVTIQGDGVLSPSRNGILIYIGNSQTVIIKNIELRGIDRNNSNPLVRIDNGGTFRMQGHAAVSDNSGNGVLLTNGTNANFIMQDSASVRDNTGTGVVVNSGTFTMQDKSSVSGNYNLANDPLRSGGGVYVAGTFIMKNNASVHNNYTEDSNGGGGVYVTHGTFTMQDNASVSNNISINGNGGGVRLYDGTFTMQANASISGNEAANDGCGGGVYVEKVGRGGNFTMQGNASISGNVALSGGGVYVYGGTFTMQGSASLSGNKAYKNGGGVYLFYGTLNKTGGTIYGSNAEESLSNTAAERGSAVNNGNSSWRNATAGPTMNTNTFGFWLDD